MIVKRMIRVTTAQKNSFFSRVNATLYVTMSVRPSVGRSVVVVVVCHSYKPFLLLINGQRHVQIERDLQVRLTTRGADLGPEMEVER